MTKCYVIDTNVLLFNNKFYKNEMFKGSEIYLPMVAISEIDNIKEKSQNSELKFKARLASREIETLIDNGRVKVLLSDDSLADKSFSCYDKCDDLLISSALKLKNEKECVVVLISKDLNVRLKCKGLGLDSVNFEEQDIKDTDDLGDGRSDIIVEDALIERFYSQGYLDADAIDYIPHINEFVILISEIDPKRKALTICKEKNGKYTLEEIAYKKYKKRPWGLEPRSLEQKLALSLLLDEDIRVVNLFGEAGSSKSILSLASALEQLIEDKRYNKLYLAKPPIVLSKRLDVGFDKGGLYESKLPNFMKSFTSNLEALTENKRGVNKNGIELLDGLMTQNNVEILSIGHILGASLQDAIIILDEGELLDRDEMSAVVTRLAENSKIIITSDLKQGCGYKLSYEESGVVKLIDTFKDESLGGHLRLKTIYRSEVANIIAKKW